MKKKYAVIGGEVVSGHDKEIHYITAFELIRLYKLKIDECVTFINEEDYNRTKGSYGNLKEYRPREDGNYNPSILEINILKNIELI